MNDFQTTSQLIGKFTDKELTHEEESRLLYQASRNPLLRNELRLDHDINEIFSDHNRIKLSETIRKTINNERGKIIAPRSLTIAAFSSHIIYDRRSYRPYSEPYKSKLWAHFVYA